MQMLTLDSATDRLDCWHTDHDLLIPIVKQFASNNIDHPIININPYTYIGEEERRKF